MATFKNRKTDESAEFDVRVGVGPGVAVAEGADTQALFDKLTEWGKPGGVADADFDIACDGAKLHRCGVAGVLGAGKTLTIDFMETE